jgi:secretion/DNA translocation related TadE-like protein
VLGALGVLLAMTVGALVVVSAVLSSHRAQSAADLAALAAAAALVRGESPSGACGQGTAVAAKNGGRLATCRAGPDLSVDLAVEVRATVTWVGSATARARAGPSTSARRE